MCEDPGIRADPRHSHRLPEVHIGTADHLPELVCGIHILFIENKMLFELLARSDPSIKYKTHEALYPRTKYAQEF